MNLYRVIVTLDFDLYCAAETQEEAEAVARRCWKDEFRAQSLPTPRLGQPAEIRHAADVPPEWIDDAPYARVYPEPRRTCRQILEQRQAQP